MKKYNPVLFLVSCVKSKRDSAAQAKDLYQSTWFKAARAYVESQKGLWLILSAKHGALHPIEITEPYEMTLNNMPVAERRQWAAEVSDQIVMNLPPLRVIFLAGQKYREFIVPKLEKHNFIVEEPLKHLGIGQQVKWLQQETIKNESLQK